MAFTRWDRWIQVWIVVTLLSLMAYDLYWIRGVDTNIYTVLMQNLPNISAKYPNFFVDFIAGSIGDTVRLIGVVLALIAAYLVWVPKSKPFDSARKYVALALAFEAVYFLSVLPLNCLEIIRGRSPLLLFVGFIVQILIVSPLLLALAVKLWQYNSHANARSLVKLACFAGAGYIMGIWFNDVFRWFSMTESAGMGFLFTGIISFGFLGTIAFLSLSVVFALAGLLTLLRGADRRLTVRLFGVALVMLGLNFAFYILYSWLAPGAWKFLLLTEIWPLPLLAVGLGMLMGEIHLFSRV